jgi:hypothetical protein
MSEPQAEQLRRCEICRHNSAIAGVNTIQPYCIKLHEAGAEITFPSVRTCANWEWDEHDTGGK